MPRVFVGVGSNIEPEQNVRRALRLLAGKVRIAAISTFYQTEAEGRPGQPAFYNGVVEMETDSPPAELRHSVLRQIECELGRTRTADKYAPRTIDLDILVYGELAVQTDDLVIPDPELPRRSFLAIPLFELAPDLILPGSGLALREIAASFADHGMKPLPDYTERLRKDMKNGSRESRRTRKRAPG
jgi:dihydroneopterin aldolase/2-amino-4-hydroxy-6-hydroxymethyldihydropteridine diphosphokinase